MRLYLVQHAKSKSKEEDPDRSLTERGRREAERVAAFVAKGGDAKGTRILHSGKTRARQTAEVFAEALGAKDVASREGLAPLDDPARVAEDLRAEEEDVMLTGHLPHLSKLAGLLLCGSADEEPVDFRNAGVVTLGREEDAWTLRWVVTPELVPG